MKLLVSICTIFFVCQASLQAAPPSKSYEMGFKTNSVFDYKQARKKADENIPRFPPRTGNALIVQSVEKNSRAAYAGLRYQDLIQLVNGKKLKTPQDGDKILKKITYKDELQLRVIRRVDNKWKHINLTMEPMSDLNYFRTQLYRNPRFNYEFDVKYYVRHGENSPSKFSPRNFQIYYTEYSRRQAQTLNLQLSMFLPGKSSMLDETTIAGFIIKTDTAKYRIVEIDEDWERKKALENELAEVKKLIQTAQTNIAEANRKNKSKEEVAKLTEKFDLAKQKYQEIQSAQSEFLKQALKQEKQHEEKIRKKFIDIYFELPESKRKMIDELIKKVKNLEDDVSETTLETLEKRGLVRSYIDLARGFQGWKFYDRPLKQEQLKMIDDIISSRKVTVHFENAPDKQFELTAEQKERLKMVLKVFKSDDGEFPE